MKKKRLKDCRLYAVIDQKAACGKDLTEIARKAAAGGADIIQLRPHKEALAKEIIETALNMKAVAEKYGCLFIINDRVDITYFIGADGAHLGQDDLPQGAARRILGKKKIIGISTHSLSQAIQAQNDRVDYISVGPVFRTPTKKEYEPVGLGLVREVSKKIKIPFFAIGGIDRNNLAAVLRAGAKRIAVVRAIVNAKDPHQAAQCLSLALAP